MIRFGYFRPKIVFLFGLLLTLCVLGSFSIQSQLITKNNQDCSTVIFQHVDSTQSYSVNLFNLKTCDCKLPGMSMNGFLITNSSAGTTFIYRGIVEDFGSIFSFYYPDIDGDGINEAIALAETEDNIWGTIFRFTLDSTEWPEMQIINVPNINYQLQFDEHVFKQLPDGSLLWHGSENSDTSYVVYYDKKSDSLAVKTDTVMK